MQLVLLFAILVGCFCQVPPSGLYLTLRSDLVNQVGKEISLQVSDETNAYRNAPEIDGSNSDVSYRLYQWIFDINLAGFTSAITSAKTAKIIWTDFTWIVQFNYHVSSNNLPVSESGWIQVYTTAAGPTTLEVDLTIDLTGPTVNVAATNVVLGNFDQNGEVFVDCTDVLCLIPVDDIANAVASGFQAAFQSALQKGINSVTAKMFNTLSTTISLPFLNLDLLMQSSLYSVNNNFVIASEAAVTTGSKNRPPFNPNFVPPTSVFSSPKGQIDLVQTNFLSDSAFWALDQVGAFNKVITNADLPPGTKYQLYTNDTVFLFLCPGLMSYPNLEISITTSLNSLPSTDIDTNGIHADVQIDLLFTIYNTTFSKPAWVYTISVDPVLIYNAHTTGSQLVLDSFNISQWNSNVTVKKSFLGYVDTAGVAVLLNAFLTTYITDVPIPAKSLAAPAGFTLSNTGHSFQNGYDVVFTDASYQQPPAERCGDGSECPVGNTCCNWGGHWGCCQLPSASCCDQGCCEQGCDCDSGQCDCSSRFLNLLQQQQKNITMKRKLKVSEQKFHKRQ